MLAVYVFAAWTLLVWGTRISNVIGGAGSTFDLALAAALVALGMAVAVSAWRRGPAWPLAALVVATLLTWALRAPLIVVDAERPVAFKVVHLALAVVSVGLALWAWRASPSRSVTRAHLPGGPR